MACFSKKYVKFFKGYLFEIYFFFQNPKKVLWLFFLPKGFVPGFSSKFSANFGSGGQNFLNPRLKKKDFFVLFFLIQFFFPQGANPKKIFFYDNFWGENPQNLFCFFSQKNFFPPTPKGKRFSLKIKIIFFSQFSRGKKKAQRI